jgi:hypothetical protein
MGHDPTPLADSRQKNNEGSQSLGRHRTDNDRTTAAMPGSLRELRGASPARVRKIPRPCMRSRTSLRDTQSSLGRHPSVNPLFSGRRSRPTAQDRTA